MKESNRVQTALVTGGAVRVGAAIVRALAASGRDVVIHCRTSLAEAHGLAKEVQSLGRQAWVVPADLDGEAACQALLDAAWNATGGLDILVNNAAVFEKHPMGQADASALASQFGPNFETPYHLTRAFCARGRGGVVVNLLDRRIESNDPSCIPYLLSKKALAEFTRAAALAYAPGFRIHGVGPGPVLPPPGEPESYLLEKAGRIPLERRCPPEEVAAAVVFLCGAPGITGQILYVDGGQHLLGNGV